MRENMGLFRGKGVDIKEWMRGGYTYIGDCALIWQKEDDRGTNPYRVDPETVGECTGLRDKNGELIFEGDIIAHDESPCCCGAVSYYEDYAMFIMTSGGSDMTLADLEPYEFEIIGNIHDNPELIGGAGK